MECFYKFNKVFKIYPCTQCASLIKFQGFLKTLLKHKVGKTTKKHVFWDLHPLAGGANPPFFLQPNDFARRFV